ncbi:hypothetical protein MTP99_012365 [Tenebrio molitor]|nr:hypothetical protein MTP99_012365 [Tenebrio molitor]
MPKATADLRTPRTEGLEETDLFSPLSTRTSCPLDEEAHLHILPLEREEYPITAFSWMRRRAVTFSIFCPTTKDVETPLDGTGNFSLWNC